MYLRHVLLHAFNYARTKDYRTPKVRDGQLDLYLLLEPQKSIGAIFVALVAMLSALYCCIKRVAYWNGVQCITFTLSCSSCAFSVL